MRNWLIELREKQHLSQASIADKCFISQQHYSYIETGERIPSVETAKKIANVLCFSWTKFFEDEQASQDAE